MIAHRKLTADALGWRPILMADYDVIFRREEALGAIRPGLGPFGGANGYLLRNAPPTGEKW